MMDLRTASATTLAAFIFVIRKAEPSLRRLVGVVATFLKTLCLVVVRSIITSVIFIICALVMLHYLGVPVPGPSELLDKFESIGELSRILS
jgi:hypothetical protein